MGIEDTVQICCPKCKSKFRDKARRVLSGYSRQCPSCECMVFFEDGSPDKSVHEVLREAARVRKALREEEAEKIANRSVVPAEQTDDDSDQRPVISRRHVDRRSFSAGRAKS